VNFVVPTKQCVTIAVTELYYIGNIISSGKLKSSNMSFLHDLIAF